MFKRGENMDTKLKEFLQTNPKTNFMQTPEWAENKVQTYQEA